MCYKKISLVLLLAGLFLTPQLKAQGIGLGPQVSYQKAADADEGRFMVGAALRLKFSPVLGVEGSINYRQQEFADDALTVRSWPVMVTGLIYPLPVVYGAVGGGWYNTTFDFDDDLVLTDDETRQEFGWHFGAGLELPVGENVKLIGDLRYVFLDYEFDEIPFEDVDSNFYMITGGLLLGL